MYSKSYLEGDFLMRELEKQCLWLGGTSDVCSELVNGLFKDKLSLYFLCNLYFSVY
jgi:hypothetical protein